MKNTLALSILLFAGFISCTKTTLPVDFAWKIGHDLQSYENQLTPIDKKVKFSIINESFCYGSEGISVKIFSKDKVYINEVVTDYPYLKELDVIPGKLLHIETKLAEHPNPWMDCVWLGNVNCELHNK